MDTCFASRRDERIPNKMGCSVRPAEPVRHGMRLQQSVAYRGPSTPKDVKQLTSPARTLPATDGDRSPIYRPRRLLSTPQCCCRSSGRLLFTTSRRMTENVKKPLGRILLQQRAITQPELDKALATAKVG